MQSLPRPLLSASPSPAPGKTKETASSEAVSSFVLSAQAAVMFFRRAAVICSALDNLAAISAAAIRQIVMRLFRLCRSRGGCRSLLTLRRFLIRRLGGFLAAWCGCSRTGELPVPAVLVVLAFFCCTVSS